MFVIRPVRKTDLSGVERCALTSGPGMTHLPRHREALEKQISISLDSFSKDVAVPGIEQYLFVLEDQELDLIGGTCGINALTGTTSPFYVYRIETMKPPNSRLPPPKEPRILQLSPYINGPSEICALYLLPEFRHSGLGKLLSLCRFLFIASHQKRFTDILIANMRGIIENNESPFWNGIGRHFLDVELQEVMEMRMNNEHLISDIFPENPIYVTLLPPHMQEIIGQVHSHTKPALTMLQQEGFHFANEIDPVDGGPIIQAKRDNLHTILKSKVAKVKEIVSSEIESEKYLVSNTHINFRACLSNLAAPSENQVIISSSVADALEVKLGDSIRYIPCPQANPAGGTK